MARQEETEGEIKERMDGGTDGGRGEVKAGRRGELIEEPRPEGRPSPICIQGKSMNIERWMNT